MGGFPQSLCGSDTRTFRASRNSEGPAKRDPVEQALTL